MYEKLIPGTSIPFSEDQRSFSYFLPLIQVTDGLTLSQVCTITSLETSTIQNWVKRGFVPRPLNKKYRERHLARILLISALKDTMPIDRVGELLSYINGNTEDESDDIISEEMLYDIFCSLSSKLSDQILSEDEVYQLIEKECQDYEPPDVHSLLRLRQALAVMLYAYTAAIFKKKSEEEFSKLSEIN